VWRGVELEGRGQRRPRGRGNDSRRLQVTAQRRGEHERFHIDYSLAQVHCFVNTRSLVKQRALAFTPDQTLSALCVCVCVRARAREREREREREQMH
jgi:hypothetical protein